MASESNANAIADFDIDEVIDWDKHDIPSKDIEFDALESLNLASAPSSQKSTTAANAGRDELVLRNQLLASQPAVGVHHRDTGATIVGIPQVSQTSSINPVFPGDPSSMIADIRQEYLHAQNSATRSRTPPTPTFPSENFDLPPITPPGSLQAQTSYSVGQQPLRMALVSNLNRATAVPHRMQTFVQPSLPQLGPLVGEPMEEGSNIEKLIDEIVERDMPQGVSEPIVFAPQVAQQPNSSTAHLQMPSQPMQKGVSSAPVRSASPGHLPVAQTNTSVKTSLSMGVVQTPSPLNTVGSPGSPLTSSRSPSPQIKQGAHTPKVSVPLRTGNQPIRLSSPAVQPGSPLQAMGIPAQQSSVISTRSFVPQGNQVVSSSRMLQMAVPSAIVSSSSGPRDSPTMLKSSSGTLQIKQNGGIPGVSSQVSRLPLSSSTVHSNSPGTVPQMPAGNVASQSTPTISIGNSSAKVAQGPGVVPITIQSTSKGKPIQGIPLQNIASNPKLLDQLVKAMGQSSVKQNQAGQATSGGIMQTGQPLICYVVPQTPGSGAQTLQTKSSIPLKASGQPVKMILVNTNSSQISPALSGPLSTKTILANSDTSLPAQPLTTEGQFGSASPFSSENLKGLISSENMLSSTSSQELNMSRHRSAASIGTSLDQQSLPHQSITQQSRFLPVISASQQPSAAPATCTASHNNNNPASKADTSIIRPAGTGGFTDCSTISSSSTIATNVVQITFVNEATAISQVVAASSSSLSSTGTSIAMSTSPVTQAPENAAQLLQQSLTSHMDTSSAPQDSDDDEDDSKPLSQVAENLKKSDDLKKRKRRKKEKGPKRKKRDKDDSEPSKPLTAYEIFFKETQSAIRLQNQLAKFEDIKKIVDQMWKNSSDSQKKVYQIKQEKMQQEYTKACEEYKAKKVAQKVSLEEDAPSPKEIKVDRTDGGLAVAAGNTAPTVPGSSVAKGIGAKSHSAMAGKPVATVTPMATIKTSNNETGQLTAPAKPKKHKVIVNPISQRICLFDGCNMPARTTKERGTLYCSNECVVKHCRVAFTSWVAQRNVKSEIS